MKGWNDFLIRLTAQLIGTRRSCQPGRYPVALLANAWETATHYQLQLALPPAATKKDVTLQLKERRLTVSVKADGQPREGKYLRREIYYGPVQRAFELPENIDAAAITAKVSEGCLNIKIGRQVPGAAARNISID